MSATKPRITYVPRPDATAEAEISALANVYRSVLDASRKKKGTRPGALDDGTRGQEDSADAPILQER